MSGYSGAYQVLTLRQKGVEMSPYFPLFVSLRNKKILVFGAGQIAARRVAALLRYGAAVTVVAPQVRDEIREMQKNSAGQLLIEQRVYCCSEIREDYADYVLAATDDREVNRMICRECRHKEIPVNNASDSGQCDFYFPALIERDGLVIGVTSTNGDHRKVAEFCKGLRSIPEGVQGQS